VERSGEIRRAEARDAAQIAALAGQLGYQTEADQVGARLGELARFEMHRVWVAEAVASRAEPSQARGGVVAWMHCEVCPALDVPTYVEILALVVDEAHRGRRIGEQLVACAETWAKECGVADVRVRSNVVRERAHRFYERLGYAVRKTQRVFAKAVR